MFALTRCAIWPKTEKPFLYVFPGHVADPNIHALAAAAGWDQRGLLTVEIPSTVRINTLRILASQTYLNGLHIICRGFIGGKRGERGYGVMSGTTFQYSVAPTAGGDALTVEQPITLELIGSIKAGGGGGGHSGRGSGLNNSGAARDYAPRDGGAGEGFVLTGLTWATRSNGVAGYSQSWESDWFPPAFPAGSVTIGTGGNGGLSGQAGSGGQASSATGSGSVQSPQSGAAAGRAIVGMSNITLTGAGEIVGGVI